MKARLLINPGQVLSGGQVALVHADEAVTAPALGDGHHPVDEIGVGHRDSLGGHHHQKVDVGHRGAVKLVFPGQDLVQRSGAVFQGCKPHPVPHQRGLAGVAVLSPGPAGGDGLAVIHIVEAAEGFAYNPFAHVPSAWEKSTVMEPPYSPSK